MFTYFVLSRHQCLSDRSPHLPTMETEQEKVSMSKAPSADSASYRCSACHGDEAWGPGHPTRGRAKSRSLSASPALASTKEFRYKDHPLRPPSSPAHSGFLKPDGGSFKEYVRGWGRGGLGVLTDTHAQTMRWGPGSESRGQIPAWCTAQCDCPFPPCQAVLAPALGVEGCKQCLQAWSAGPLGGRQSRASGWQASPRPRPGSRASKAAACVVTRCAWVTALCVESLPVVLQWRPWMAPWLLEQQTGRVLGRSKQGSRLSNAKGRIG